MYLLDAYATYKRRSYRRRRGAHAAALAAALAAAALAAGCGSDQPASTPASESELKAALRDAPSELKAIEARSNRILDGGAPAFKRQLGALKGVPIVVNKWASWCGPCRFEFPFFQRLAQKHAGEIAFLGVDSLDSKEQAREFLRKYPVPYPSFFDPEGDVAKVFNGDRGFPTTAFYDRSGEIVLTKQGGYSSQQAIEKDIRRYAR
jgi:cytochrome c biogenesis protein CcmG, thiol:disulfide interchange protein DsbE